MKKLSAILLIGILFFNWYGYRLLSTYWQQRADRRLETRLDNNDYDESSLISIKIPLTSLSYANASTAFERIEGEIIVGDIAYMYVKRRILNDSVELLCIRNTVVTDLREVDNRFFRLVNNLTHFPGSSKSPVNKDFQKIYSPVKLSYLLQKPDLQEAMPPGFILSSLPPGHARRAERPPDSRLQIS